VAGFIGDIPRCCNGVIESTNGKSSLGGQKFGSTNSIRTHNLLVNGKVKKWAIWASPGEQDRAEIDVPTEWCGGSVFKSLGGAVFRLP
jgi:hypothetical protein